MLLFFKVLVCFKLFSRHLYEVLETRKMCSCIDMQTHVVDYISDNFGVDRSSHFYFRARSDRHTQNHIQQNAIPML